MRVVFIGTGRIGVPSLRALFDSDQHQVVGVVTQRDKPVGRHQTMQAPPTKEVLSGRDIPILQPARIKDEQAIAQIRTLAPEIIVVMAYGQILPRDVLGIPTVACLNLHASLLPRWRGAAPIQAAIAAGDRETGITVMYMDEGLDTGDILLQRKAEIKPDETGESLHAKLSELAPEPMMAALHLLGLGRASRQPQDNTLATYAPKLNRAAGRIDWSRPADAIERQIRAYHPWPGAFTTVAVKSEKPRNLKVFSATVMDQSGAPGEVIYADKRGLVIATGRGALSLQQVQLEGKERISATELVHGYPGLTIIAS